MGHHLTNTRPVEMMGTREKVLAVHVQTERQTGIDTARQVDELRALIQTDGGDIVETMVIRVKQPSVSTLLGSGQVASIHDTAALHGADVVVFNRELAPLQQRNIEGIINRRVIDRTRLIIDIFARRARSREGKLEVEEALLRYMLPRLTGKGVVMSQTGGGVGTRGPGETKLEMDRRKIKERLGRLKRLMDAVRLQRKVQQSRRAKTGIPLISIVGYTSAGKSTLLNRLTGAGMQSSESPFTSLDPVSRRLYLGDGSFSLITDTVGFIEELPVQLVKAFRTTLDDVTRSDVLLFVVDVSKMEYENDISVVHGILGEIGADRIPTIYVFNKIDRVGKDVPRTGTTDSYRNGVLVSAREGTGIDTLRDMIARELTMARRHATTRERDELYRAV
ncbi:MAG: GTPase HflX [Deltaproteobacteria bacterium]|nr:GTPase HflX [Deltaproteobacteria bacterium]MCL5276872.1 GTPase HflX [Deltaproteobacteria bacterium]